jgi:hypothetical protein
LTGDHIGFVAHNPCVGDVSQPQILKLETTFEAVEEFERAERFSRRLEILRDSVRAWSPLFGHISYYLDPDPTTALERGLNLSPAETIGLLDDYARGYSWITVLSHDFVNRLGGVAALESSGAFSSVESFDSGSVWLQATTKWSEYDMSHVNSVFNAIRPVLLPGKPAPSKLRRILPDLPPELVVFEAP